MTLIERILDEALSDDEDDSDQLERLYKGSTPDQQKALDAAMLCICGWSLKTLIEAN